MKSITLLSFLLLTFSCGDSADDKDGLSIIEQPLEGTINGESFTFVHGIATMDDKQGTVFVTLLPVAASDTSDCSIPFDYKGPRILFIRKPEVGGSALTFEKNVTFSYETPEAFQNDVALTGEWRFDFVDDNVIKGALAATTDGHEVNGTFELTRCPDPFANF